MDRLGPMGVGQWRSQQLRDRPQGYIGYGRLEIWASLEDSPNELLLWMTSNIPELRNFLNSWTLPAEMLELFMTSLNLLLKVKVPEKNFSKLLEVLASTRFYTYHMLMFLVRHTTPAFSSIAETLLRLIKETAERLPDHVYSCRNVLLYILQESEKLSCQIAVVTETVDAFNCSGQKGLKKMKHQLRKWRHTDEPPDNIGDLSIFPNSTDLDTSIEPFLRANRTRHAFRDKHHYLDVHFRLFREDFIQPLREGLARFREGHDNNCDMKFYTNVRIVGLQIFSGIEHVLRLDIEKLGHIRWDSEKRLIYGSLVCLSADNFRTIIYATVTQMEREELKEKGLLRVQFQNCLDDVYSFSSEDQLTMTENPSYFEAYRHVLEGLQEMDKGVLPMEKYLVKCQRDVTKPAYLTVSTEYDLSSIEEATQYYYMRKTYPALQPQTWPALNELCLNQHQLSAVSTALTNELALLQGPPGTGKTYVGLKIMQILLQNAPTTSPILVVCYTNHALDQFLEEMLEFCPEGIVRVGGRSKSEVLEKFNIRELRMQQKYSLSTRNCVWDIHRELDALAQHILNLDHQIQMAHIVIQPHTVLCRYMYGLHLMSLYQHSVTRNPMTEWLMATDDNFESHLHAAVEAHAIGLIMKSKRIREERCLDFRRKIPIIVKISVYHHWVSKLNDLFQTEAQTNILPDSILQACVTPSVWKEIHEYHPTVKSWLIGESAANMLDSIEEIQAGDNELENRVFDNMDEYLRLRGQRLFGDESDNDENEDNHPYGDVQPVEPVRGSLFHRSKALGVDLTFTPPASQKNGWQTQSKTLSVGQVIKCLKSSQPFQFTDVRLITDLWCLTLPQRYRLYKFWVSQYVGQLMQILRRLVEDYNATLERKKEIRNFQTEEILSQAKVIGMTTTGAAKHREILKSVGPQIVVAEEAAEVLEAHIVTALSANCQHLILIGDHQQLRPKTEVHQLALQFGLEISMFERLINNGLHHVQLTEQHRMRPDISTFMRYIYPHLTDSESVHRREDVRGMAKNVFFIKHNEPEDVVKNSKSKLNDYEAKYLIRLCSYLLLQGYDSSEITILGAYGGQVALIKKYILETQDSYLEDVRVSTVDNFQGEQNKIILLSLVRSNKEEKVGFLSTDNRVCVALSRAQYGMYVIGDLDLLSRHSQLWRNIQDAAISLGCEGKSLPVQCRQHGRITEINHYSDFDTLITGGCGRDCCQVLVCSHVCPYLCHAVDHDQQPECEHPCGRLTPCGHVCRMECHMGKLCPPCQEPCQKRLWCGHRCPYICHGGDHIGTQCGQRCEKELSCGHPCPSLSCHGDTEHLETKCEQQCEFSFSCGHRCPLKCHDETHIGIPCEKQCPTPKQRSKRSRILDVISGRDELPCGHHSSAWELETGDDSQLGVCQVCELERLMERLSLEASTLPSAYI